MLDINERFDIHSTFDQHSQAVNTINQATFTRILHIYTVHLNNRVNKVNSFK